MAHEWQPFTVHVILYATADTHGVTNTQIIFAES